MSRVILDKTNEEQDGNLYGKCVYLSLNREDGCAWMFRLTLISTHQGERHLLRGIKTYTPYTPYVLCVLLNIEWGINPLLTKVINHSIKDIRWS